MFYKYPDALQQKDCSGRKYTHTHPLAELRHSTHTNALSRRHTTSDSFILQHAHTRFSSANHVCTHKYTGTNKPSGHLHTEHRLTPSLYSVASLHRYTILCWCYVTNTHIITLLNKIFLFSCILICYFCDAALNFQHSLLQSSVSHDLSEIIQICWFAVQATFLIVSVENSSVAYDYVETMVHFPPEFFDE